MRIIEVPLHLTNGFLQFSGDNIPPVAPVNQARLWYDRLNAQIKFSVNGGAYTTAPNGSAAPPASATQASLLLDSGSGGTAFAGSANGTVLGINLGTGTANLIDAQKAGSARFSVTETGIMTSLRGIFGGTTAVGTVTITSPDTAQIPLVVRPAVSSPSANYFEVQNNTGASTHVFFGGSAPFLGVNNSAFGIFYNGQISTLYRMAATADAPTVTPLATRGSGAQTADLFRALDSGNVARVSIGSLAAVANALLTLRAITSQTGNMLTMRNAGDTADLWKVLVDGRAVFAAPNSAVADASLHNSSASWYLDAGENNIIVKVKLAAGTIKTATIAIA